MSSLELLSKIEEVLELFQYARILAKRKKAFHVTEITKAIASPRSHRRLNGAEVGRKAHEVLWSLDPYIVLQEDCVSLPFPLAAEIEVNNRKYIIYGVPDLVLFKSGVPKKVYEFKSYLDKDKYSIVQTQIYAWLTWKCFSISPKAYLILGWNGHSYKEKIEVKYNIKEVEEEIKKAVMKILGC